MRLLKILPDEVQEWCAVSEIRIQILTPIFFFNFKWGQKKKGSSSKLVQASTLHNSTIITLQDILGSKSVVSLVLIHVIHYHVLPVTCRDVSETIFLREREREGEEHTHTQSDAKCSMTVKTNQLMQNLSGTISQDRQCKYQHKITK
jgi:hypothetical protein